MMASIIKKPKYIRKYDFIRYFSRSRDEWFLPTKYVSDYIQDQTKKIYHNYVLDEDEEEIVDENDFYSFYVEQKQNQDMDENDPKIIEGKKIDKESKKSIISHFFPSTTPLIYDFDNTFIKDDENFIKTMKIIKENKDCVIFQPCFIYNELAIAKPDAIVIKNGKINLVEVKGTSTAKIIHLLDIIYQSKIIKYALDIEINDYFLCLVKYELLKKNEISFILTNKMSFNKTGMTIKQKEKLEFSNPYDENLLQLKQNYKICNIEDDKKVFLIKKIVTDYQSIDMDKKPQLKKVLNDDTFIGILYELNDHKITTSPTLIPCSQYKINDFKNVDYWLQLRDYYYFNNQYFMFSFSGNLIEYKNSIEFFNSEETKTEDEFFKFINNQDNIKNAFRKYYSCVEKKLPYYFYDKPGVVKFFNSIKPKRVWFDFESLNLATRVIDDTPPFMQIVNQVSIIIEDEKNDLNYCNNLIFDPKTINSNDYKKMIDAIVPDENPEQYSYIVYYDPFELTRLNEMKYYLNDEKYTKKIDIIKKNIIDLADFFDLRKDSCLIVKELNGFFSIKKVLPYIEKNNPEVFKLTKCKNYKTELNIHNGAQAQEVSTKRFFNLVDDLQWEKDIIDLKKYCENDIRAMICVYLYIKSVLL